MSLQGKTIIVTGASRGIGRAIALRAAKEGANITIAAKTVKQHPKLPGTIYETAHHIEKIGGKALPVKLDVRDCDNIKSVVEKTIQKFGAIDACINNAGAISMTPVEETEPKKYDLIHAVNGRAAFFLAKYCVPHLLKAENPHILSLSPPLVMNPEWFVNKSAYAASKYMMSFYVVAMAEEFKGKIAVNALWPKSTIATAAIKYVVGDETMIKKSRKPEIIADAAYLILQKPYQSYSGNLLIDEDVLKNEGYTNLEKYRIDSTQKLQPDLFVTP